MTVNASESDRSGTTSDVRIAILSSDRGGHLQALLEDPVVGQWVALVVADRPDAYPIRHAEWHGVSAVALRAGKSNLDLYDLALVRVLEEHSIDYVVVAGFPRIGLREVAEHRVVDDHAIATHEVAGDRRQ